MNRRHDIGRSQGGRFQWGSFGFLAGVLLGIFDGVVFRRIHRRVHPRRDGGLVIIPVVLIFLAWRKFVAPWLRPPAERYYVGPSTLLKPARSFTKR